MKERLYKLLSVKSILTLIMAAVLAVPSLRGTTTGTEFLAGITTVIGFYFGTQHEKKNNGGDNDGTSNGN